MIPYWSNGRVVLWQGDCIPIMADLTGPYDMILADLPYGTTACKWDTVIPFAPLWEQYKRLIKRKGAVVLFGSQPFTSALVMSNAEWFKYCWVWRKSCPTGFLDAKHRPLNDVEDVCVFNSGGHAATYNPQMTKGEPNHDRGKRLQSAKQTQIYGRYKATPSIHTTQKYPRRVLSFKSLEPGSRLHPTQKPVALLEYLIRTYTNPGETVLDNTMGSGATGVACVNTGRSFVGIEMDAGYFEIARQRIEDAQTKIVQLGLL